MALDTKVSEVTKVQQPADSTPFYWQKYVKPAAIVLAVAIAAIGGWLAYNNWVVQPKEEQAENAIYKAQQYYAQDSVSAALNGDGSSKGFVSIINNYGGTKTANIAKYYAGVCNLKLGKFNDAVKYLSDFSIDSKPIQMKAYGCLGDAYSELKKNTEAIDAYKKAAATFEFDEINTSEYLFRAGLLNELSGKNKEALDLYKEIKTKYPNTMRGGQIDKYIYRLSIEPNEFSSN